MTTAAPGVLLVLDGWGSGPSVEGNALAAAHTPVLDDLLAEQPRALLDASGEAVGLPAGTVGNSEIGHMVIGAGRPVPYDSLLVQRLIDTGGLRAHPDLLKVCDALAASGRALHLVGLCSDGRIHSHVDHLAEFLAAAARRRVREVFVHVVTDGRDVADGTARHYLDRVEAMIAQAGVGRIATVLGRGFAMDKAGNLALTERAGLAIADGVGAPVSRPVDAVGDSDEWTGCSVVTQGDGRPVGPIVGGDAVLFTHFRSDRIAQLADFLIGHTEGTGRPVRSLSLAQYDTKTTIPALVHRADAGGGLADALARAGLRSVRIAEAEKFEHITYYLNGRDATRHPVEEHVRIHTSGVRDYRSQPAMRLGEVADAVIEAVGGDAPLVVANLANIDVVGHTGDLAATVAAAEHTDAALSRILTAATAAGRWVVLVGDHGNAEHMIRDGAAYGGHTTNPVPFVLITPDRRAELNRTRGTLADVAPTVLALLGHPPTATMTGSPLL